MSNFFVGVNVLCMQVRRRIINECKGQPKLQKALAIALLMKQRFGRSSILKNYTINKIHKMTGISATTLNKYLPVLIEYGWVSFCGKNNQHIVVSNLASHTDGRNIKVDRFCFDSFFEVYRSLRAFIALIIQSHKDFIKRTIQIATDPKRGQDFKAARKLVKRLVKQGVLRSIYDGYNEFGLSYRRIASEIGNCIRTAQRTIQYAIDKSWVVKEHHSERIYAPRVNYDNVEGFSFSTKNNLYIVYANTYTLSNEVDAILTSGLVGYNLVGKK